MTQTELTKYFQPGYDILHSELSKRRAIYPPGHPDFTEVTRAMDALAGLIIIRDELRRLLPPEHVEQAALLDVPRKGGY